MERRRGGGLGAVVFVGERFGAHRVASIDPEAFYDFQATRPLIDLSIAGGSSIVWPEVELLVARSPDGPHDLLLVAGAEPSMRWRTFCTLLLDAAASLGVTRVVTLGSLLADVVHSHPVRITGMASDPAVHRAAWASATRATPAPPASWACCTTTPSTRGLETVSMWAPVSHYAAGLTNSKGSLALVRALDTVAGVGVDVGELEEAAAAFEGQVARAVEAEPRLRQLVEQLEDAAGHADEAAEHGPAAHRRRAGRRAGALPARAGRALPDHGRAGYSSAGGSL